jgi:hypothetical protein
MLAVVVSGAFLVPAEPAGPATLLGTVRGPETAKLSLNGGKSWLTLGGRALPVMPGTEIRSAAGTAQLTLADGSRVNVMPFSTVRFAESGRGTEMALVYGRLSFSLPAQPQLEIATPTARLEPVLGQSVVGEMFVTGGGLLGLKMSRGTLNVRPLSSPQEVMVASLEPVFVPRRPSISGTYFSSDMPKTPPALAKAVFTPAGQSVGYIARDGSLVIYPGFTKNLTRPFSTRLVRLAMNSVPPAEPRDAVTPLFDVNGGYVGYLSGPVFYAQTPAQPPSLPVAAEGTAEEAATAAASAGGTAGMATGTIAGIGATAAIGLAGSMAATGVIGANTTSPTTDSCPQPATLVGPPSGCP